MIKPKLSLVYFLLVVLLLFFGCSSTPTIIEKPHIKYTPEFHTTIELVQDTVYLPIDSNAYWIGNVEDSLENVIGWLKVYYNKKIAELNLNAKQDTFIVHDTIPAMPISYVETVYGLLPSWAQIILITLCGILFYFSAKSQIKNFSLQTIKNWIKKT